MPVMNYVHGNNRTPISGFTRQVSGLANYVACGDGRPVILVHGIAASLHDWYTIIPGLAQAGYCACALDLLGHGDSHKPEKPDQYHIRQLLDHLEDWLDSLRLDDKFVLVAHSLGAYLSLAYSLRRPERIRGLVLVNPFYSLQQLSPLLRFLNRKPELGERALQLAPQPLIQSLVGLEPSSARFFSAEVRRQIALDYKRASPSIFRVLNSIPDLPLDLSLLQAPCLVLWGEDDHTLAPASFEKLVTLLPVARLRAIPACGHQPHIALPHLVNQEILDFLAELGH